MKKYLFIATFLLFGFANAIDAEKNGLESSPRPLPLKLEQKEPALPIIKKETPVTPPPVQEKIKLHSFNVVLEPLHMTTIYAEITTPILKINRWMGESFKKDDVLMILDNRIYEGNFEKAAAAVTRYTTELASKKQLFLDDALSQFELDEAISSLAAAEADLIIAKKYLDDTLVKAPYNGRVVKVNMKEYELALQGKELITLVDDDWLFAKFLAPSSLINCVVIDMPLEIRIKETGNKINAKISRIAPVIDPSSATFVVEAKIDNKDKKLWAGMSGWVTLTECDQQLYKRPL